MGSSNGYVLNWKKIEDWRWFKTHHMAHLFQHLIREANYEPRQWEGQTIERGQAVIGRKSLAEKLGLSEQIVRSCLNRLKSTGEITIKSTNRYSIVTIHNYNQYQDLKKARQPSKRPTVQPTDNQQITTPNEVKEDNEDIDRQLPLPEVSSLATEVQVKSSAPRKVKYRLVEDIPEDELDRLEAQFPDVNFNEAFNDAKDWQSDKGYVGKDAISFLRRWCRRERKKKEGRVMYG